jgi:hypothetical protein
MKHAPSLEGNTTRYILVGNAEPAPFLVPSPHYIHIIFTWLYYALSLELLLLKYVEIYRVCEFHELFYMFIS